MEHGDLPQKWHLPRDAPFSSGCGVVLEEIDLGVRRFYQESEAPLAPKGVK